MSARNFISIIGNVGQDPRIADVNGTKVAEFSVATNDKRRDADGNIRTFTEWHNVAVWGKRADVIEKYLKKGAQVAIQGKLEYRNETVKVGKEERTFRHAKIRASEFEFLDRKPASDEEE